MVATSRATRPLLTVFLSQIVVTLLLAVFACRAQSSEGIVLSSKVEIAAEIPHHNQPMTLSAQPAVSNSRRFHALPSFLTAQQPDEHAPLTSKEKFDAVVRSSFDYSQAAWFGVAAGISQAQNHQASYGQGAAGYSKRYASAFADSTIGAFMQDAVFPSLLRQDPRYFRSGQGTVSRRSGHALAHTFVARGDSGRAQPNLSLILGGAVAAAISTYSYHPARDRNLRHVAANGLAVQVGSHTLTAMLIEFWPDLRAKMHATQRRTLSH